MDLKTYLSEADDLLASLSDKGDSVIVQKLRLLILLDHSNILSVLQTPGPLAPIVTHEAISNFANTKSLVFEFISGKAQ
ncbi:hypothetical protein YA0089_28090 [Pseudomonas viridiflava]|uniref:hypothetical protein n=1 Tax=Pseudomonas viridiflava TaxID=33069 RepID=UPI0018E63BB2|nr:hypothetical protein [Pseudomonas viridiflava]MBI6727483.1 hypothetical protein [Pseudomonas viridiflava]